MVFVNVLLFTANSRLAAKSAHYCETGLLRKLALTCCHSTYIVIWFSVRIQGHLLPTTPTLVSKYAWVTTLHTIRWSEIHALFLIYCVSKWDLSSINWFAVMTILLGCPVIFAWHSSLVIESVASWYKTSYPISSAYGGACPIIFHHMI